MAKLKFFINGDGERFRSSTKWSYPRGDGKSIIHKELRARSGGKKQYTLKEKVEGQKTKDAHYKFVKIRDAPKSK